KHDGPNGTDITVVGSRPEKDAQGNVMQHPLGVNDATHGRRREMLVEYEAVANYNDERKKLRPKKETAAAAFPQITLGAPAAGAGLARGPSGGLAVPGTSGGLTALPTFSQGRGLNL